MSNPFDVIVLGLGGIGSAAAYQLASRGKRVLGIDQFAPAHDQGSSHGKSRVIRQAYFEDPSYVPLLLRSYDLWERIERESECSILTRTGGLMIGAPDCTVVKGSLRSARLHGLEHEMLDAAEIHRRYPVLSPSKDTVALYEKAAGFLRPEEGVRAHLKRAKACGATLNHEEPVIEWSTSANSVLVKTRRGIYEAEQLVISPGAWAPRLLMLPNVSLEVERQVLYWYAPVGGTSSFTHLPIYIWEMENGLQPYGFPAIDGPTGGVKVAFFRAPTPKVCDPDHVDRFVQEGEIDSMRNAIGQLIPTLANSKCLESVTCLYTNTPDEHFIVSRHPHHENVTVACGFSGHGYKFCPVIGEILSDLVIDGSTSHDINLFNINRPTIRCKTARK